MKLQSFTLQIFDPQKTIAFYTEVLGFSLIREVTVNGLIYYELGFQNPDFYLRLQYNPVADKALYQEKMTDNYWKYSLFVDDIQEAYQNVLAHNFSIGVPFQFGDIGYLAHTADTEQHKIEYIQKTFEQNGTLATKEQTALGLITIRTKDPVKILKFYEEVLDMKLFVRMYVNRGNGFTLYFLGAKDLEAPNPNIDAIENREWMYQQRHLFIEIQHFWGSEQDDNFNLEATQETGLQSINFSGDLAMLKERLSSQNISYQEEKNGISFKTLDDHIILVTKEKYLV
ncbi:VOC family protein [uncultured Tenacibaculum sp.]|uniref:VOC family protein n=1 Tax=uncultured Tenacibaculum sp. TaxID=174713 RepID=UPI00261A0BE2|nr:VOC family protein [uncultured Tenacibaculum sp.]